MIEMMRECDCKASRSKFIDENQHGADKASAIDETKINPDELLERRDAR